MTNFVSPPAEYGPGFKYIQSYSVWLIPSTAMHCGATPSCGCTSGPKGCVDFTTWFRIYVKSRHEIILIVYTSKVVLSDIGLADAGQYTCKVNIGNDVSASVKKEVQIG